MSIRMSTLIVAFLSSLCMWWLGYKFLEAYAAGLRLPV